MSAGYVAKAIWLAADSEPGKKKTKKKKSHCSDGGWRRNLDVSTLFYSPNVRHT